MGCEKMTALRPPEQRRRVFNRDSGAQESRVVITNIAQTLESFPPPVFFVSQILDLTVAWYDADGIKTLFGQRCRSNVHVPQT